MASGKVIQDPVTGEYVVLDANGNEVSRYPASPPSFSGLGSSAPSGGSTMLDANGKAIPTTSTPADPMAAPQQALPTTTSPDTGTIYDNTTSYGRSYNQRSSGSSPSGGTPWYDSYSSDPFAGFGGGQPAAPPQYADGSLHPSQGGAPRVPGGVWNTQPDDGYDNRQQVRVPGGPTAGPFEVSAAPTPSGGMTGNYGAQGGSSHGGGGGGNYGANSGLGQQMRAKVEGMAAKISGGGSSGGYSSDTSSTQQYRRDGRRMDRANAKYYDDLQHPPPLPVRGWAKEHGYAPGSVSALLDNPGAIYGTEHPRNQFNDDLAEMPMTDLALMSFGTQGRNLMSKTPVVRVPHILRQNGVDPTKPDYKRTLDPSKVANKIAEMYGNIGSLNRADLMGNMATASKNSALRQGIRQQAEYDPGRAFDTMQNYILTAAGSTGPMQGLNSDITSEMARKMQEMGPQILGRKPKRMDRGIQDLANAFL